MIMMMSLMMPGRPSFSFSISTSSQQFGSVFCTLSRKSGFDFPDFSSYQSVRQSMIIRDQNDIQHSLLRTMYIEGSTVYGTISRHKWIL